jgi:hypothetical protein
LASRLFLCEQRHGPPALEVWQNGESIKVPWSLVDGTGGGGGGGKQQETRRELLELRRACVAAAHAAPLWQERVPPSYARLRRALRAAYHPQVRPICRSLFPLSRSLCRSLLTQGLARGVPSSGLFCAGVHIARYDFVCTEGRSVR